GSWRCLLTRRPGEAEECPPGQTRGLGLNASHETRADRQPRGGWGAEHGPAVDQDGGGGRLAAGGADWKPSAVQASDQEGPGHDRREGERRRPPADRAERPAAGWLERGSGVSDPLRYLVVIEHADRTGYSAWAPDLPGCVAAAGTREECEQLMR